MSTEFFPYADDFAAVFSASIRQTLRTALGRACQIVVAARLDTPPKPTEVGLALDLKDGGEGALSLMLAFSDGAMLADLMMMGDGKATWSDEHADALQELGSQMAGALSTAQSERWGRRISFQPQVGEGVPVLGGVFYPLSLEIQGMEPRSITLCIDPALQETLKVLDNQRQELSDFPHSDDFQEGMASDSSFPGAQPSAPSGKFSRMSAESGVPAAPVAPVMSMPPPPATPQQVMIDSKDPSVQRLLDVPIEVTIELGQTELSIRRILEIGPGSIIELDRMAGEPVDLVVNDKVIAHGEVVVIEENFGIRITQLVTPDQRNRPSR